MDEKNKLGKWLETVQKPTRYCGGEFGQIVKSHDTTQVRYAFCFPDIY